MAKAGFPEEGQIVHVGDIQRVPDIETGTGSIGGRGISVDEADVVLVRRIVDGVGVGVGEIESESTHSPESRNFQSVIARTCRRLNAVDSANAVVGPEEVRVVGTGNEHVHADAALSGWVGWDVWVAGRSVARDDDVARGHSRCAIVGTDGLTDLVRIRAGNRMNLVQIDLTRKMRALTTHIGDGEHDVLRELALKVKVPLLHVRPSRLSGNRNKAKRSRRSPRPNVSVTRNVGRG